MKSIKVYDGMELSWDNNIYTWNKEKSTVTSKIGNTVCTGYPKSEIIDQIEAGHCKIVNNTYEIY